MNIEQSLSTDNTKDNVSIKKRRQFIKTAGVPVILTFSSPSVFGALCASEIASGNQSHTGTGSCSLGFSPAHWANPANKDQWPEPYKYGVLPPGKSKNSKTNSDDDDKGGTQFKDVFETGKSKNSKTNSDDDDKGGTQFKDVFKSLDKTTLSKHLRSGTLNPTVEAFLAAALLNAASSKDYPISVKDVIELQSGNVGLPWSKGDVPASDRDIIKYLEQTWDNSK